MASTDALTRIIDTAPVEPIAEPLSRAVRDLFESAGPVGKELKNALHGVWLGHPLHPVFTDVPIGAWTTALALDAASGDDADMKRAATFAMGVGLLGALGSALTGLTDWSETDGRARREGLIHGLLNIGATALMTISFARRRADSHEGGRACAWAGYAIAVASAYLGGDLVYARRIGVTHAVTEPPETFTQVAVSREVREGVLKRGRHEDTDVVLTRHHSRVCALTHACAHLGGPLSEGSLKDGAIECPWHGSQFALDDGRVVRGPATQPQPIFAVLERDGEIFVKEPE